MSNKSLPHLSVAFPVLGQVRAEIVATVDGSDQLVAILRQEDGVVVIAFEPNVPKVSVKALNEQLNLAVEFLSKFSR